MKDNEYQGRYRIGQAPAPSRLKEHNAKSWVIIENFVSDKGGTADFYALSAAVKDHESGNESKPHPYQFIIYCIDNGWLERVET
jgi:hypothetical protein